MAVLTNTMLQGTSADTGAAESFKIQKSIDISQDLRSNFKTGQWHGNEYKWTWSAWIKRANVKSSNHCYLFAAYPSGNDHSRCMFATADNRIQYYQKTGGTVTCDVETLSIHRDPSAWMHFVFVWDTGQDDQTQRVRMYINGVKQRINATTWPSQWMESSINQDDGKEIHTIGGFLDGGVWRGTDASLANIHFIDGVCLSPAAFGKWDDNNQWQADEFALPTPNTGKGAWSGMVSGDDLQSSYPATAGFDGKDGYKTGMAVDGSGTATFTPTGGITADSEIRIHIYMRGNSRASNYDLKLNGISVFHECYNYEGASSNQWRWYTLPSKTLTTLQFGGQDTSTQWMRIGCIEVDGVLLKDNTTDETDRTKIWPGCNHGQWYGLNQVANGLIHAGSADTLLNGDELGQIDILQHATNYVTITDNVDLVCNSTISLYTYTGNSTPTMRITNTGGTATVLNNVTNSDWTDWSYTGTIKKIELGYLGGTGSVNTFRGIKIDGVPLVKRGRDNSYHLDFNKTDKLQDLGWSTFNPKLETATGALPIYNTTDDYGQVKGSGYRTDSDAADLLLAIPGNTIEDVSHSIRGSGSALTLTTHGPVGTSDDRSRFYGTSICFNDRKDWLSCTSSDFAFGTGDFTIECWVWLDEALDADTGIFQLSATSGGLATGTTNTAILYITGSGWKINANDGPKYVNMYTKAFAWNHVAYVRHSGTTYLYVNGTAGLEEHADTANLTGTHLAIGCYYNDSYAHKGFMNDFRVYDKAKYTSNFKVAAPYEFCVGHETSPADGNRLIKMTASTNQDYFGKALSGATGAKPVLVTTDTYGSVTSGATRTHSTSNLLLAIPCNSDANCSVDKSSHGRTVTNNGSIKAEDHDNPYYGGAAHIKDSDDELVCDGGSDFNFGSHSNPTSFTVEMWVHLDGSQSHSLVDTRTSNTDTEGFLLYVLNTGQIVFYTSSASKMYTKEGAVQYNKWQHIALQRETNTWKVYVNGKLRGNEDWNMHPSRGTWRFGKGGFSNTEGVKGYMQDIRLYATKKYSGEFVVTRPPIPSKNVNLTVDSPSDYLPTDDDGNNLDDKDGGITRGNYATLNPLACNKTSRVISDDNLKFKAGENNWKTINGTMGMITGKYYWEIEVYTTTGSSQDHQHGISNGNVDNNDSSDAIGDNSWGYIYAGNSGKTMNGGTQTAYGDTYGSVDTDGSIAKDTIGVAFDADNGNLYFYKNGTIQNSGTAAFTGLTSGPYVPVFCSYGTNVGFTVNFGQRPFKYQNAGTNRPAADYKCLCSTNMSDLFSGTSLNKPSKYFDILTYTGNEGTQSIKGLSFQPDLLWLKNRDYATDHQIYDAVRGTGTHGLKRLRTNTNGAEAEGDGSNTVNFLSDGFSLSGGGGDTNDGGGPSNYVAWNWDAGTAAVGSPGSSGDMTASVQWVNATAGFSISKVVKPDNTADQTFEHGLGAKPSVVLQRRYDVAEDWYWYTSEVDGSHDFLILNSNAAKSDTGTPAPTNSLATTMNAAGNYIVYCWTPIPGFSAFGSTKGTGSTSNNHFVYTGFKPALLIMKNCGSGGDWQMYDSFREADTEGNARNVFLEANDSQAETNDGYSDIDFLANGFKIRGDSNDINLSGETHFYMAWAKTPFKITRAS